MLKMVRTVCLITGFSHIRDWESLAVLLPPEYSALLSDIPELREYKDLYTAAKPLFCVSPPTANANSTQFSPFPDGQLRFVFMYINYQLCVQVFFK